MSNFKSVGIAIAAVVVIVAAIVAVKLPQFAAMGAAGAYTPPPESVSVSVAEVQKWPTTYTATGTVEASEGITVSAEVAGKVSRLLLKPGALVKAGEVLLEQEASNERAQLEAANARLKLAELSYQRLQPLRAKNTISQSDLDTARAQLDSAQGEVNNLKATLDKKIVRAPFAGRLGIRQVDLGQDLQIGAPIISLQASDLVRINFPVSQHSLAKMQRGMPVTVEDGNGLVLGGQITALAAELNPQTRNALVQASLSNKNNALIPGMAVTTVVHLSEPQAVLAVPSTAIIYATFGDTLFIVDEKDGGLLARQQFVRLGSARGDFVEVTEGLKEGERVVSAGAFKLFSGQAVTISDAKSPPYDLDPRPADH